MDGWNSSSSRRKGLTGSKVKLWKYSKYIVHLNSFFRPWCLKYTLLPVCFSKVGVCHHHLLQGCLGPPVSPDWGCVFLQSRAACFSGFKLPVSQDSCPVSLHWLWISTSYNPTKKHLTIPLMLYKHPCLTLRLVIVRIVCTVDALVGQ